MGFYVNSEDFTGKFALSQGLYNTINIDYYIERFELTYLTELFGVELYNLYYANANGQPGNIPTEARFLKVYNAFTEQSGVNLYEMLISRGLKDMLIGFIYFEAIRDQITTATPIGMQKQKNELSEGAYSPIYERYNESVKTYQAIQKFMYYNFSSDYPEFRGVNKYFNYWI
jgi:hypothetical protein